MASLTARNFEECIPFNIFLITRKKKEETRKNKKKIQKKRKKAKEKTHF